MYKESDLFFSLYHDILLSGSRRKHQYYIVFIFLTDMFSEFPKLMNVFFPSPPKATGMQFVENYI